MDYLCFLQCGVKYNSTESNTTKRWKQLETKTKDWEDLDKFGNVFESTDWEKGAEALHVRERYYITLSSRQSLQQSRERKEKENAENCPTIPQQQDLQEKECQPYLPKRLRSSIVGPLYHKNKCVWCMKGSDKKSPTQKTGKLMRISTLSRWREFKRHTVNIKNCCVFNYLSLLKLYLLFRTHLLQI